MTEDLANVVREVMDTIADFPPDQLAALLESTVSEVVLSRHNAAGHSSERAFLLARDAHLHDDPGRYDRLDQALADLTPQQFTEHLATIRQELDLLLQ